MPRIKTCLVASFSLLFVVLLVGCDIFVLDDEESEEPVIIEEGRLPDWLLADHRFSGSDNHERNSDPVFAKEDPEPDSETEEVPETRKEEEKTEPPPGGNDRQVEEDTEDSQDAPEPEIETVTDRSYGPGTYSGDWLDGKPHGEGTFIHVDGGKYEGEWKEGNPHGQGTLTTSDGKTISGIWNHGEPPDQEEERDEDDEDRWWES